MAIFKKKETATKADPKKEHKEVKTVSTQIIETKESAMKSVKSGGLDLTMVLVRPHVTEKGSDLSEKNVYVFEIHKLANKAHVRQAVEKLFKVQPVKVAVINGATKYSKNPRTNRMVMKKASVKKAMVYLKAGDKIEFV